MNCLLMQQCSATVQLFIYRHMTRQHFKFCRHLMCTHQNTSTANAKALRFIAFVKREELKNNMNQHRMHTFIQTSFFLFLFITCFRKHYCCSLLLADMATVWYIHTYTCALHFGIPYITRAQALSYSKLYLQTYPYIWLSLCAEHFQLSFIFSGVFHFNLVRISFQSFLNVSLKLFYDTLLSSICFHLVFYTPHQKMREIFASSKRLQRPKASIRDPRKYEYS